MALQWRKKLVRQEATTRAHLFRFVSWVDSFMTPERMRVYPLILLVVALLCQGYSTVNRILDPTVLGVLMPDYLAHWTGGRLLLTTGGENLYDPATQGALQLAVIGSDVPLSWFVSMPIVGIFYAPLSVFPYNLSGLVWFFISTVLLLWCVMSLRTLAPGLMKRRRTTVILSVLASPVVFELLGGGQDSAFILAVWLIAMRLLASNQAILAGAVFGLGSAKPQLVVIVPLVLLATRSYRALSAFAAVSSLLLIASIGAVGFEGIQQWLAALSSPLYTEAVQQGQAWKMVSLPSFVQSFVPPGWQAWAVPVLTFLPLPLGAIFLLKQAIRNGKLSTTSTALWIAALATTLTFSPHLLSYDAILFVPVIMYLLENRPSAMLRVSTLASFAFLYFMPVLHLAAGHLPWPLAVIDAPWPALPLAYIWWQALLNLREESPSPISQAPDADVEAIPTTAKRVMF